MPSGQNWYCVNRVFWIEKLHSIRSMSSVSRSSMEFDEINENLHEFEYLNYFLMHCGAAPRRYIRIHVCIMQAATHCDVHLYSIRWQTVWGALETFLRIPNVPLHRICKRCAPYVARVLLSVSIYSVLIRTVDRLHHLRLEVAFHFELKYGCTYEHKLRPFFSYFLLPPSLQPSSTIIFRLSAQFMRAFRIFVRRKWIDTI